MSDYTAEDFKNAMFAEHKHGAKAVRWEMNYRVPWHTAIGDRFSDEQMAENGWRPVVEARITEYTPTEDRLIAAYESLETYGQDGERQTAEELRAEAKRGIEAIKRRGIGIGHLAAQENMQASIGAAFRGAKVEALRAAAGEWRKHLHSTEAGYVCTESWLRDRANRIEEEGL